MPPIDRQQEAIMKKSLMTLGLITLMIFAPSLALAGGYYNRGYYPPHYRGDHYRPHSRAGYAAHYNRRNYHPHRHYRPHGDYWAAWGIGLFTGAVVSHLFYRPPAYGVVYERPAPVVVERQYVTPAPQALSPAPLTSGKVSVSVGALNVRSGPGLTHAITSFVRLGEVLEVSDSAPGWLYVRTPTGHTGWVMTQYTRAYSPAAG